MGKYEWNKYVKSPTEIYKYRGQLKDTKIDGKGEFKWPDGRQYFGEFFQGTMNGNGKLIFTDKYKGKAIYQGNFLVNHFHGKGKLIWSNGDIYTGNFENGHYEGKGVFSWADGKRSYEGCFSKGLFEGIGKYVIDLENNSFL